ncbi:MAG TPA: insulinase family protein [Gammaproteobacteria bacterium]|nr:insulinase family protein [Gammaproteobacteria bacterium]
MSVLKPWKSYWLAAAIVVLGIMLGGVGLWMRRDIPMPAHIDNSPFRAAWLIRTPDTDRVTAHLIIQSGEADQTGPPGLMHYAEHLAWQNAIGSESRPEDRDTNAWAESLATGYWLSGDKSDLVELISTLARVLEPIELPRDFMEEERDILLREYDLRFGDNTDARVARALRRVVYEPNPLARPVLGTRPGIAAFEPEDAVALHTQTHKRENTVLIVIGDVSVRELRAALPDLPAIAAAPPLPPPFSLGPPGETVLRFRDPDADTHMVWRRIVALDEPQQIDLLGARLALLRDILDTSLPGGLAGPLRYDAFVTRAFDIELWPLDERHIEMRFTAWPDEGVSLAEMRRAFEAAFEATARAGIPAETFARVRERFETFWPDWTDDKEAADWMAGYVIDTVSARREPLDVNEIKALKTKLERAPINALLGSYLRGGRTVVAFVGKQGETE